MARCAKSWHTPRALFQNFFQRRRHGRRHRVVFEIGENPPVQIGDGGEQRRFGGKTVARVIRQFRRRAQQRRVKNKLIRLDHFRRNRIGKNLHHAFPIRRQRRRRRRGGRHRHAAGGGDFQVLVDFLDAETANLVAEKIHARLDDRRRRPDAQRKIFHLSAAAARAARRARRGAKPSPARRIHKSL